MLSMPTGSQFPPPLPCTHTHAHQHSHTLHYHLASTPLLWMGTYCAFPYFPLYIELKCWMFILNMAKVSNNSVNVCKSIPFGFRLLWMQRFLLSQRSFVILSLILWTCGVCAFSIGALDCWEVCLVWHVEKTSCKDDWLDYLPSHDGPKLLCYKCKHQPFLALPGEIQHV